MLTKRLPTAGQTNRREPILYYDQHDRPISGSTELVS